MDNKEYFEKVMQDYNQNRNGRSLRKYCKDEAVVIMIGSSTIKNLILYRKRSKSNSKMLLYQLL